ncbi:MAG: hypothetical protein EOO74_01575 [Myxococcales bacterium]|nr:MAG: hypothetical protein EOO74_01575 [Myxococcales bacterium]
MVFNPQGRQEFNGVRGQDPLVVLTLAGKEILFAERYTVKVSVLTQPAAFSLTLGTSKAVKELLELVTPHTPFALSVNGRQVMQGRLDGLSTSGGPGTVQVEGRDALAPLHDAYLRQEETYKDDTYASLVRKVMDTVGLKDTKLVFSNKANREAVVGLASQAGGTRAVESLSANGGAGGQFQKHFQSQLGERAYEFLKRHLDRAGLFLWAAANGDYILSEPNPNQAPLYLIQRSDGATPEFSDIEDVSYQNRTTERFSEVFVYTHGELKKAGRGKTIASFKDEEMIAWGINRPMILRDVNADSAAKATFMAKRKIAESRRAGWKLSYTLAGHTTGSPQAVAGSRSADSPVRPLWYPDTIVRVDDARLGIAGEFWIEAVTYQCGPQATTLVELMRVEDLVFGETPPTPPVPPRAPPGPGELPVDLAI